MYIFFYEGIMSMFDNLEYKVAEFITDDKRWNLVKFERAVSNKLVRKVFYIWIYVYDIDYELCWGLTEDGVFFIKIVIWLVYGI